MTEMGAEATEVAPETTESTEEATTTSKATLAGKLAGTNAFASLNPIGDFAIFISRVTGATKKGDGNEAWIDMATGIATSLLSMAAMFSAVKGAANSATAIGKAVDDPAVMTKMTNQINNLILAMNAVSAGLGINVGVLKIEQGQKELELGKLKAVATEIKALTDFFQSLVQDEQKWVKQNNEMDKQLSQSFEYDEFANFSQVSLHA